MADAAQARDDGPGSCTGAGHLKLPRPLRLLRIAGWSLAESAGLPVAAYLIAASIDGRDAGLVAGLAVIWLTAVMQFPLANLCMGALFARTAGGPDPLVARLAAEVVALRQPATRHPGLHRFFQAATWPWAGIFLLLTVALAVLMVTEPTTLFLLLSTVVTAALVIAGTGASTWWFLSVLRSLGLRVRFAPA
jgi:hypothetical protein